MTNSTSSISTIFNVTKTTAAGCIAASAAAGFWVYDKLITEPLRIFYFVGPVWGNLPKEEICAQIAGDVSGWWASSPDRMQHCEELLERRFHSWDAGIMCALYFAVLTFATLQLTCHCCFLRPILKEIRKTNNGGPPIQ